jgi:hypothetical protein
MDERHELGDGPRVPAPQNDGPDPREASISGQILDQLGAELTRGDESYLSDRAKALIRELSRDARQRGVTPERLIVVLKNEIRAATTHAEYRRRPLVEEAVTRCIRQFFAE